MVVRLPIEKVHEMIGPVAGPGGSPPSTADVVVVGAGPIGLTAANMLGWLGIRTVLLERNAMTADLPRALAVDDEYMRLLDLLDLTEMIEPHKSEPFGIYFYSRNGDPVVKVPAFTTRNGFGNRNGVMQPVLEKLLLSASGRYDHVAVRYGCEVVDLEQSADGLQVAVAQPDGGRRTIRARYLLACDGARSFVRNHLGIAFEGRRIDEPHLVLDLADFPDDAPYSKFHCNPQRPFNSIPTPYGGRRLEFMLNADDDRRRIAQPDSIRKLVDATSYRGAPLHVVRSVVYGYSERIAQRMQEGNVFLLGDAAHVMPPFGAQAMNTGARDVNNLCWKISAVLSGTADARLLATYDPERRPQITAIARYSVRIGKLANLRSRPAAFLRDTAFRVANLAPALRRYLSSMRYMPKPRIDDGFLSSRTREEGSLLGQTFPRVMLLDESGGQAPFDHRVRNFALVGIDVPKSRLDALAGHPLVARLSPIALLIRLDGRLPQSEPGVMRLVDAGARALLGPHRGQILLVRPDRYVAAAAAPAAIRQDLDRLLLLLGEEEIHPDIPPSTPGRPEPSSLKTHTAG